VWRVGEVDLTVGLEVRGRLAVRDDEQHRLRVRVLAEVPVGEQQGVVQVGALRPHRVEGGELLDLHHLGVPAEPDQLQVVAAEAGADQLVQGQRRALHRHPAPVHRHRERRVHQQGDRGLGARLGLLDLDVLHLEQATTGVVAGGAAAYSVHDRPRDVPGLGVAEGPLTGGPGKLTRGTRQPQVALTLPSREPVGDVTQQRLAELAHRLRREPQLAVGVALEVAGVAQRTLELLQGSRTDRGLVTELAGERVEVDVVHPRPVVRLRELLGERVELGEVLEDTGAVAEPEALLAAELLGTAPVLAGPQRLEIAVEAVQGVHQLRAAERLRGQRHQLLALLGRHRVEHPLGGRGALGERVEQLVDVLRVLREVVPVLVHELVEVLLGVGAQAVLLEQLVEVREHLVDRGAVLVGGVLQRLLHARKALVEQLAAEQVLDLLVVRACLRALPVVRRELGHGRRGRGRPTGRPRSVELDLTERPVRVVQVDVAGQLLAFLEHGVVEQLANLLERAVEAVPLEQLLALPGDLTGQLVEPLLVAATPAEELLHRTLGRVARHHVLADVLQGLGEVDRRGERVRAALVPGIGRVTTLLSHGRFLETNYPP
jgi:hypothetical protein